MMASSELIYQEFTNAINELRELFTTRKIGLELDQFLNLINKVNQRIKIAYNELIKLNDENYLILFYDSIPKLIEILNILNFNFITEDQRFELIILDIKSSINFMISSVIFFPSKEELWKRQGTVAGLFQIIINDHTNQNYLDLLSKMTDPIRYKEFLVIIFNLLNSFSLLFVSIIHSIKSVGYRDLQSWTEMAFYYNKKILDFVDIADWERYTSVSKTPKTIRNLVSFQEIVMRSHIEFMDFILYSLKWYGQDISKNINTGLINNISERDLDNLESIIMDKIDKIEKKNEELLNKGFIKEGDLEHYNTLKESAKEVNKTIRYRKNVIKSFLLLKSKNISNVNEIVTETLELNTWYYNLLIETTNFKKNENKYSYAQYIPAIIETLIQRICLLAFRSVKQNSLVELEKLIHEQNWIFEKVNPKTYFDLFLFKTLSFLYVKTRIKSNEELNLELELEEVKDLKAISLFRPKDFTSLAILELILGFCLDKVPLPSLEDILISINKHGIIISGDHHLYDELQEYLEIILANLNEQPYSLSIKLLKRKEFVNEFDPITWLVPDFNSFFKDKLKIPIYYLPFNRVCDGIIK